MNTNEATVDSNQALADANQTSVDANGTAVDSNGAPVESNRNAGNTNGSAVGANDEMGKGQTAGRQLSSYGYFYSLYKKISFMTTDYIPRSDGDMLKWTNNFSENLPTYAKTLGLSDEDIAAMQTNCTNIDDGINDCTKAQALAKESAQRKVTVLHDNTGSLRTGIQRFKKNPGYTEAIGKALGVVGTDDPVDPNTFKPKISADVFPGHVTVKFTKKGVQGVNIYSKLQGDDNWAKLAFDSYSPYEDNRPLHAPGTPETRQYAAMGVVHDHEIGLMSDIVEVTFGG